MADHRLQISAEFDAKDALKRIDQLEKEVKGLGGVTKRAGRDAKKAADDFDKMAGPGVVANIGKLKGALIGISAALGGLVLVRKVADSMRDLITQTADLGDALQKTSIRTGASVEFLSAMTFAAEQSGAGFQELTVGIRTLSRVMNDAQGGLAESQRSFEAIGVSAVDARGQLKSVETILPQLADAFSKIENDTKAAALAQELFGRSGTALLPFLRSGSKGLNEFTLEAQRLGIVFGRDFADAAADANDALNRVRKATLGLKVSMARELLPVVAEVADKLSAKLADPAVRQAFESLGKALADAVEDVPDMLDKLPGILEDIGKALEGAAKVAGLVIKAADAVGEINAKSQQFQDSPGGYNPFALTFPPLAVAQQLPLNRLQPQGYSTTPYVPRFGNVASMAEQLGFDWRSGPLRVEVVNADEVGAAVDNSLAAQWQRDFGAGQLDRNAGPGRFLPSGSPEPGVSSLRDPLIERNLAEQQARIQEAIAERQAQITQEFRNSQTSIGLLSDTFGNIADVADTLSNEKSGVSIVARLMSIILDFTKNMRELTFDPTAAVGGDFWTVTPDPIAGGELFSVTPTVLNASDIFVITGSVSGGGGGSDINITLPDIPSDNGNSGGDDGGWAPGGMIININAHDAQGVKDFVESASFQDAARRATRYGTA